MLVCCGALMKSLVSIFQNRRVFSSFIFACVTCSLMALNYSPSAGAQSVLKTDAAPLLTLDSKSMLAPESTAMTEDQVIAAAIKSSRQLRALSTHAEIATYRLKSSGMIENPELRISDVSTRYYTDEFDELRVGLRFRLPKLGELSERKQQARVDLGQVKVDEIRYRQEMIAQVRKDLADVLLADQLVELAQKKSAKADERLHIIEQLVDQGERSIINMTKAKIWCAESKNDLARARQNQKLARQALAKQTGIDATALFIHNELPQLTKDLDALINVALDLRPELEFVGHQIELARQQKQFETLKLIPWFNFVEISYHSEKPGDEDWGEFITGINLPLFDWNLGNIKATQLAVKNQEAESAAAKELIEQEVRAAHLVFQDLWLDWTTFRASA
ncbi:MAG: TolC family protein, partial [Calditrichaeota bacterium]